MRFLSTSEQQTFSFAKKISKKLNGGEIIGLVGDLGAGKTVFTKGLARGLGVKKTVISPTFVLMRVYSLKRANIRWLLHIDAYRLKSPKDLLAIGADEYFNRPDAVTVIEWADKIKKILPRRTRLITITHRKNKSRIIKT
ncbi:MAG: tRNA (adenosine(37)-N6)-threonylcarbamoyltransferase complex ATPase subunit type 1 TsaE [Patescibacteria group bacterium]|nr:tRNA (adenosine(37)-N6)-threonylcarbamoyltransferase complex ATPase subunit type 1 TsaE [Patescibacteria group bacterium]